MGNGTESTGGQTWDAPFQSITATVITDRRYRNKFRHSRILSCYEGSEKVKQIKCKCGNSFNCHPCSPEPAEGKYALDTSSKAEDSERAFRNGKLGQLLTECKVNWKFQDGVVTAYKKNLSKFMDAALERFAAPAKPETGNKSDKQSMNDQE